MKNIKFDNFTASYLKDNKTVIKDLSILINQGEMIAIIGKSGAGKTTIFNAILKQLNTQNGSLLIDGENIDLINKKKWKKIINKVGYLSQEANLIEDLNVYENILHFYPKYKNKFFSFFKIVTKNQKQEIYQILEKLNILDKVYTKISDLSGGQKQRVEIAKLFLKNVDIILADEPTSSLDVQTSLEIMNILKIINEDFNTTILINIHDINILQKCFNKYIFIKNGELIKSGNPRYLTKKTIEKLYQS
ncbi:ATP-binding cassette domain-containing protein [Metamycoplasma canadense]|nr:ATP-binding cassette domain-containing protein [Metamycoplasma canadense]